MSIGSEQIKKLRVRYLKCSKGDLHEGEVLNFICIDPACRNKGLICPVCQSTTHEGHQTLHLKLFLSEVNKTLYNSQDSSELSGLSEYLRSLDTSKRQMIKALREMVEKLAGKIKEVEQKIQKGYCSLRKIILSQSTVSMRLPELYRLLTQTDVAMDQQQIFRQIGRYSQLLQYKNGKVITVDSSKNLVNEYSSKAGSLAAQLTTVIDEAAKIFKSLPLQINKFGTEREKPAQIPSLAYSPTDKSWGITVVSDKKVQLATDCYGGIVFTPPGQGEGEKKIAFKIVESPEGGAITLGIADPAALREKNFEINYDGEPGLYGMCSFGFLPQDLQGTAFIYAVGDTIDIKWNPKLKKLSFERRHGIQKCETTIPVEDYQAKKLQFFTMITGPGDSIEIVE